MSTAAYSSGFSSSSLDMFPRSSTAKRKGILKAVAESHITTDKVGHDTPIKILAMPILPYYIWMLQCHVNKH